MAANGVASAPLFGGEINGHSAVHAPAYAMVGCR
jgi:hypothetical protein